MEDDYCSYGEVRPDKIESCSNCALCYEIEKLDYSHGGCEHSDPPGYICMAFGDEGKASWLVGQDIQSGLCEAWTKKEGKK